MPAPHGSFAATKLFGVGRSASDYSSMRFRAFSDQRLAVSWRAAAPAADCQSAAGYQPALHESSRAAKIFMACSTFDLQVIDLIRWRGRFRLRSHGLNTSATGC